MTDVELKRKVTLKRKRGDTEQGNPLKKSKWKLWLWLAPLLLVLSLVVGFIGMHIYSSSDNSTTSTPVSTGTAVEQPALTPQEELQNATVETDEKPVSEETSTQVETTSASKPVTTPANSANQAVVNPVTNKTSVSGSIEEKAQRVIRGDFGNGMEREQALGNEYREIQQKVNEMYRNGSVY